MKRTKREAAMEFLRQRDRLIMLEVARAAISPLRECRCRRPSSATRIGGQGIALQICHACIGYQSFGAARDIGVTNVENEILALHLFEYAAGLLFCGEGPQRDPRYEMSPQQLAGWQRLEVDPFEMNASPYREGDLARALYDHYISGDLHVMREHA